tara:strand:- start:454 stop:636 length:183 start_codon:yes stop_codon:yes gene_type:complete
MSAVHFSCPFPKRKIKHPKVKNNEAMMDSGSGFLTEAARKKTALPKKSHHDVFSTSYLIF